MTHATRTPVRPFANTPPGGEPPRRSRPRRRPCRGGDGLVSSADIEVTPRALASPEDWVRIFGRRGPFFVEIGVGRDTFLIDLGKQHPGHCLLGFEYSRERVERLARKIVAAGVTNIRLLRCEALQGIARFLAPESVEAFSVFFPDPWPKRCHEGKRVVSLPAMRLLASRLMIGGKIYLKTDDRAYAGRMIEMLERTPFLRNAHGTAQFAPYEGLLAHETLYERKWRKEGRTIFALVYVRTEEP
jgi:tRNA (guanine-N7-)-methyltransferase